MGGIRRRAARSRTVTAPAPAARSPQRTSLGTTATLLRPARQAHPQSGSVPGPAAGQTPLALPMSGLRGPGRPLEPTTQRRLRRGTRVIGQDERPPHQYQGRHCLNHKPLLQHRRIRHVDLHQLQPAASSRASRSRAGSARSAQRPPRRPHVHEDLHRGAFDDLGEVRIRRLSDPRQRVPAAATARNPAASGRQPVPPPALLAADHLRARSQADSGPGPGSVSRPG